MFWQLKLHCKLSNILKRKIIYTTYEINPSNKQKRPHFNQMACTTKLSLEGGLVYGTPGQSWLWFGHNGEGGLTPVYRWVLRVLPFFVHYLYSLQGLYPPTFVFEIHVNEVRFIP